METAQRHGLAVIEDTCHVWDRNKGPGFGSIGVAAFYSYDPGKPFIIGMGGAATSILRACGQDADLANAFRKPKAVETAKLHLQYVAHR